MAAKVMFFALVCFSVDRMSPKGVCHRLLIKFCGAVECVTDYQQLIRFWITMWIQDFYTAR